MRRSTPGRPHLRTDQRGGDGEAGLELRSAAGTFSIVRCSTSVARLAIWLKRALAGDGTVADPVRSVRAQLR